MSSPFNKSQIEGITDVKTIIALTGSFNGLPAAHRDIPFRRDGFPSVTSFASVTNITGATFANFAPMGVPIELVSTSADDSVTGLRARRVRVWGLGPAPEYKELTVEVEMGGLTPVNVPGGFTYINKINVIDVGTTFATNNGVITLRRTSNPASIYAQIDPNNGNVSETALFIVPGNCFGIYHGVDINTSHSSTGTIFRILVAATVDEFKPTTTFTSFNQINDISLTAGSIIKLDDVNVLPPLSVITVSAFPLAQAGNGRVSGRLSLSIVTQSDGSTTSVGY